MKALEGEFSSETVAVELPRHLKQNIIDEILQRLRSLNFSRTDIAKERGECMFVNFADKNLCEASCILITLVIKYCVYSQAKLA